MMALAQQPLHAVGVLRLGDLARVGRAHRRNMVGVVEAGLEKRDLPVKLEAMHVIERPRQLNVIHMPGVKHPLVRQVVHGKHRFSRASARRQVGRRQAGVPVMGMHHIRAPERIQSAGHFTSHPAQQRKAQDVVGISVLVGIVVRAPRTVIEMRGVYQVDPHAVKVAVQQRDPPGEGIPAGHHLGIHHAATDIGKRRQQHARIDTLRDLRRRQCADDVRQTARL
ncbi:Uncharacterised protein [Klebsiella pneumoniae]|nr:Uncharacterised protein [Klebsiella pneumoniae]